MKVCNRSSFFNALLILSFFLIPVSVFISCDNFMNNQNVKNEILDQIAYNNAPECKVLFSIKSEQGKFLGNEEQTLKVGYETEIQFEIETKKFLFLGLEALSKDKANKLNDFVQFTKISGDDKNGTFKYKIKMLQQTNDILIQPACSKLPELISPSPSSTEANYANTPIQINFNTQAEAASITAAETLFNYNNILIIFQDLNRSALFNAPEFNEDKTILTLTPKSEELSEFIKNLNTPYIDIKISFSQNLSIQNNEHQIPLSDYTFTVRYKKDVETTPPEKYDFFITRQKITLETAGTLTATQKFLEENVSLCKSNTDENKQKIDRNKTNGLVYLYGRYYDTDSGVRTVTVTEQRTNYNNGSTTDEEALAPASFTPESENVEFSTGDGITRFCIPYQIKSEDGAVLLKVNVIDEAGNTTTDAQSIYAIKKGTIHAVNSLSNQPRIAYSSGESNFSLTEYNNNLKTIKFIKSISTDWGTGGDYTSSFEELLYGSNYILPETYKIYAVYKDRTGKEKSHDFEIFEEINNETTTNGWKHTLDVDSVAGFSFTFIITDELDNKYEKEFSFPKELGISEITQKTDKIEINFFYPEGTAYSHNILLYETETGDCKKTFFSNKVTLNKNINYHIISQANNGLWGAVSSTVYTTETQVQNTEHEVEIENVTVTPITDTDTTYSSEMSKICIKIKEASWNNFDRIYYVEEGKTTPNNLITKEVSLEKSTSNLWENSFKLIFYGIKGQKISAGKECLIEKLTDPEYDNIAPVVSFNISDILNDSSNQPDSYILSFSDSQSGPDHADVYINGKIKYTLNQSNSFNQTINAWELENEVIVKAYDKNGNVRTRTLEYPNALAPRFLKTEKTGASKYTLISEETDLWDSIWKLFIYELNTTTLEWTPYSTNNYSYDTENFFDLIEYIDDDGEPYTEYTEPTDKTDTYMILQKNENRKRVYTIKNLTLANGIYKIIACSAYKSFSNQLPTVRCFSPASIINLKDTTAPADGNYNLVTSNGNSKSSVGISSDAPVFVHTCVTTLPYEECKDWAEYKWETSNRKQLGEKYINFTTTDYFQKKYAIPVSQIDEGSCYVVIAHFANGETVMSQVMEK